MKFSKVLTMAAFAAMITSAVSAEQGSTTANSNRANIIRSTDSRQNPSGSVVNLGDSLQTSGNGRIRLQLEDGSFITLAEETEITLDSQAHLRADHGRLRANLKSVRQIQTPSAIVSASNSDVAIEITPSGATNVICLEGSAEIRSADPAQSSSVSCDAGEIVVVKAGRPPRQPQLVDDRTVLFWKNITDPDQAPDFTPFP